MTNFMCIRCKHLMGGNWICKAFPGGIPQDIKDGKFNHRNPHTDDNGIQFEPYKEGEA